MNTKHCSECGRECGEGFCAWHVFAPLETMTQAERQTIERHMRPALIEFDSAPLLGYLRTLDAALLIGASLLVALVAHAWLSVQAPHPGHVQEYQQTLERAADDAACLAPARKRNFLFWSFCG